MTTHLCGTWSFCAQPFERQQTTTKTSLSSSSSSSSLSLSQIVLNAIEEVELNPNQPTVGRPGSVPNSHGDFELDAAWMRSSVKLSSVTSSSEKREEESNDKHDNDENDDDDGECGAVFSLRGFNGAIRAAQQVALYSPHSILAGQGAEQFARKRLDQDPRHFQLLIEPASSSSSESKPSNKNDKIIIEEKEHNTSTDASTKEENSHQDTLGVVALRFYSSSKNKIVELIAAVSSSGLGKKEPGRIGDSPIFGSGLYLDEAVGAVTATGDGDAVALFPIAFVAVQEMKRLIHDEHHIDNNENNINIVDLACQSAIQQFLKSPNVVNFMKKSETVKNRLSKGGPLIGLCGVCYYSTNNRRDENEDDQKQDTMKVQTGGACCPNWTYEYVTSHLSFDEGEEKRNTKATIRKYD